MDKDTITSLLTERDLHFMTDEDGDLVIPFLRSDGRPGLIVYLSAEPVFNFQAGVVGAPSMEGAEAGRFSAWWNAHRRWPKAVVNDDGGLVLLGDLPDDTELPVSYLGQWFDVQVESSFLFLDELVLASKVGMEATV